MTPEDIQAIGLKPEEAIAYFAGKVRVPTSHWTDVWRAAHAHGFMVAGAAKDALLQDFQEAIAAAIADGTTLAAFRESFNAIVEKHGWVQNHEPGWRAQIIYETNLAMAYSAGEYSKMVDPDVLAAFPYWQYVHSGSLHPRLQHLAWNGLTLRADDGWWGTHYPPNGWHCGCRVRVLSGRGLARQGKTGPDHAPDNGTLPWRNPKTGEVSEVPVGIDPGFDYNPGAAWLRAQPSIPEEAKYALRVPTPPPAPRLPNTEKTIAPGASLVDAIPQKGMMPLRTGDGPLAQEIPSMTPTEIRQAGPYTITTDGEHIYSNGKRAVLAAPPKGSPLAWLVDTGVKGANGKADVVGLTPAQYQIHKDAIAARANAIAASPRGRRDALAASIADLAGQLAAARRARIARGTHLGTDQALEDRLAAARQALADFDAANPELRAAIDTKRAADEQARKDQLASGFVARGLD